MKNFKNFIFIGSNGLSKLLKEISKISTIKVTVYKENSRKTLIILPNIAYQKQRTGREIEITVRDNEELSELLNGIEFVSGGKIREMDQGTEQIAGTAESSVNIKDVIILKSPPLCGKMFDFLTETQGLFSNENSNLCASLQRSRFYATDRQTANSMHVLPISEFSKHALVSCGSSYFPKITRSDQDDIGLHPKIMNEVKDLINEEAVDSSGKKSQNSMELEKNIKLEKGFSEFETCLSDIFYDSLTEELVLLESQQLTKNSKSSPAVVEIHEFSTDDKPEVKKSRVLILTESRFKKLENSFVKFQAKKKIKIIEPLLKEYNDKNEIIDKLENKFVDHFKKMNNTDKKKNLIVMNFELPRSFTDEFMTDKNSSKNDKKIMFSSKTFIDFLKSKTDITKKRRNRGNLVVVNDQIFKTSTTVSNSQNKNVLTDDNKTLVFLNDVVYKELEKETMINILNRKFSTCEKQEGNNPTEQIKIANIAQKGNSEIPLDNLIAAVAEKNHKEYVVRSKIVWEVYEHYERILERTKILNPSNEDNNGKNIVQNDFINPEYSKKNPLFKEIEKKLLKNNEIRSNLTMKNVEETDKIFEKNQPIKNEECSNIQPATIKVEVEHLRRLQTAVDAKSRIPVKAVGSPKTKDALEEIVNSGSENPSKTLKKLFESDEKFIDSKPRSNSVENNVTSKGNDNVGNKMSELLLIIPNERVKVKGNTEKSRLPRLVNPINNFLTRENNETFLKQSDDKNLKNEEISDRGTKKSTAPIEKFINLDKLVGQNSSSSNTHSLSNVKEDAEVEVFHKKVFSNKSKLQSLQETVKRPGEIRNEDNKPKDNNTETVVEKMVHQIEIRQSSPRPKIIRREQGTFVVTEPKSMLNKETQKQYEKNDSVHSASKKIIECQTKTTLFNQKELQSRLQQTNLCENQTDKIEAASEGKKKDMKDIFVRKKFTASSKKISKTQEKKPFVPERTVNGNKTIVNNINKVPKECQLKLEKEICPSEIGKQLNILQSDQNKIGSHKTSTGEQGRSNKIEKNEISTGELRHMKERRESIDRHEKINDNLRAKEDQQAEKNPKTITNASGSKSKTIRHLIGENTNVTEITNGFNVIDKEEYLNGDKAQQIEEKSKSEDEKHQILTKTSDHVKDQMNGYDIVEDNEDLKREKIRRVNDESGCSEKKGLISAKAKERTQIQELIENNNSAIESDIMMNKVNEIAVFEETNEYNVRETNEIPKEKETRHIKENNQSVRGKEEVSAEANSETKKTLQTEEKTNMVTSQRDSKKITNLITETAVVNDQNKDSATKLQTVVGSKKAKENGEANMMEEILQMFEAPSKQSQREETENVNRKILKEEIDGKKTENVVKIENQQLSDKYINSAANALQNITVFTGHVEIIQNEKHNETTRKEESNLTKRVNEDISSDFEFKDSVLGKIYEPKNTTNKLHCSAFVEKPETDPGNSTLGVRCKGEILSSTLKSKLNNESTENFKDTTPHSMEIFRGSTEERTSVADKDVGEKIFEKLEKSDNFSQCCKQNELERVEKGIETVKNSKDASVSVKEIENDIEVSQGDNFQNDVLKKSASENVIIIKAAKKDSEETVESALGITKPFLEQIQSKVLNFVTDTSKSKVKIRNLSFRSQAVKKCKEITALLKKSQEILLEDNTVSLAKICNHAKMMNKFSKTKLLPKRLNGNTAKTTPALLNTTSDKSKQFQVKKFKRKTVGPEGLVKSAIENKVTSKMKALTKTQEGKRIVKVKTNTTPRLPTSENDKEHSLILDEKKQALTPSTSISNLAKDSIGSIFAEIVASALVKCGQVAEDVNQHSDSQKKFTHIMDMAQDVKEKIKQVEICVTDEDMEETGGEKEENKGANEFLIGDSDPRKLYLNVELKRNKDILGDEYKCNVALVLDTKSNYEDVQESSPPLNTGTCQISKSSVSCIRAQEETPEEVLLFADRREATKFFSHHDPKNGKRHKENILAEQDRNEITGIISENQMTEINRSMSLINNETRGRSREKISNIKDKRISSCSTVDDENNMSQKVPFSSEEIDLEENSYTNLQNSRMENNINNYISEGQQLEKTESTTNNEDTLFRSSINLNSGLSRDRQKAILKVEDEIKGNSLKFIHTQSAEAHAAKFNFDNISDSVLQKDEHRRKDLSKQLTIIKNNEEVVVTIPSRRKRKGEADGLGGFKEIIDIGIVNKDEKGADGSTLPIPDNFERYSEEKNKKVIDNAQIKSFIGNHGRKNVAKEKADEIFSLNRQNRNSAMKYLSFSDEYTKNTMEIFPEVFLTPFSSNTDLKNELDMHNNEPEENFGVFQNPHDLNQVATGMSKIIHIATNEDSKRSERNLASGNDIRTSCRVNDFPNSKICMEKEGFLISNTKGMRNYEYLKKRIEQDRLINVFKSSTSRNEVLTDNTENLDLKGFDGILPDWKKYNEKSEVLKEAFADLEKMGNSIQEEPSRKENSPQKCSIRTAIGDYLNNSKRDFGTKNSSDYRNQSELDLKEEGESPKYSTINKEDVSRVKAGDNKDFMEEMDGKTAEFDNLTNSNVKRENYFYHEMVRRSELNEIKKEEVKEKEEVFYKNTFYIFNAKEQSFDELSAIKKVALDSKTNMQNHAEIIIADDNKSATTEICQLVSNNESAQQKNSESTLSENEYELEYIDSEISKAQKLNDGPTKKDHNQNSITRPSNIPPENYNTTKTSDDNSFTEQGQLELDTSEENIKKIIDSIWMLETKKKSSLISIVEGVKYEPLIVKDLQEISREKQNAENSVPHDGESELISKPKTSQIPTRSPKVCHKHKVLEKFATMNNEPGSQIYKIGKGLKFDLSTKKISKNAVSTLEMQKPSLNLTTPKSKTLASQENVVKKPTNSNKEEPKSKSKKMILNLTPSKDLYSPPSRINYDELKRTFLKHPRKLLEIAAEILDKNQYLNFLLDLKSKREIRNFWWKKIYDGISSSLSLTDSNLSKVKKGGKASTIELKGSTKVKPSIPQVAMNSKKEMKVVKKESLNLEPKYGAARRNKKMDKFVGGREKVARQNLSTTKPVSSKPVKASSNSNEKAKKNSAEIEIDNTRSKSANLKSPRGNQMLNTQGNSNRRNLSSQYREPTSSKSNSLPYTLKKFLETPDLVAKNPERKVLENTNFAMNYQTIFVLGEEFKVENLKNTAASQELPNEYTKFSNKTGNHRMELSSHNQALKNLKDRVACQKPSNQSSETLLQIQEDTYENQTQKDNVTRMLEEDLFQVAQLSVDQEDKPITDDEKSNKYSIIGQTDNSIEENIFKEPETLRATNIESVEIKEIFIKEELRENNSLATSENQNKNEESTESGTDDNIYFDTNTEPNSEKTLVEVPIQSYEDIKQMGQSNGNSINQEDATTLGDRNEVKVFPIPLGNIASSATDISEIDTSSDVLLKDITPIASGCNSIEERDITVDKPSELELNNSYDILSNRSLPIYVVCSGVNNTENKVKKATDFDKSSDLLYNNNAPIGSVKGARECENVVKKATTGIVGKGEILKKNSLFDDMCKSNEKLMMRTKQMGQMNFQTRRKFENPLNKFVPKNKLTTNVEISQESINDSYANPEENSIRVIRTKSFSEVLKDDPNLLIRLTEQKKIPAYVTPRRTEEVPKRFEYKYHDFRRKNDVVSGKTTSKHQHPRKKDFIEKFRDLMQTKKTFGENNLHSQEDDSEITKSKILSKIFEKMKCTKDMDALDSKKIANKNDGAPNSRRKLCNSLYLKSKFGSWRFVHTKMEHIDEDDLMTWVQEHPGTPINKGRSDNPKGDVRETQNVIHVPWISAQANSEEEN